MAQEHIVPHIRAARHERPVTIEIETAVHGRTAARQDGRRIVANIVELRLEQDVIGLADRLLDESGKSLFGIVATGADEVLRIDGALAAPENGQITAHDVEPPA